MWFTKSTQIHNINTYTYVKISMNDGTHKEENEHTELRRCKWSFSGSIQLFLAFKSPGIYPWIDKDQFLLLLFHKDRSLMDDRSILDASAQKTMWIAVAPPWKKPSNHNVGLEATPFCSRKLPLTFTKLPKLFSTQKPFETWDF